MAALAIRPTDHVIAIASGGCNVLSYLTANPARITAVDLNGAHIALGHLKLAALRGLPDYDAFLRFFGNARTSANIDAYESFIAPHLDTASRAYWEGRQLNGRRRIAQFSDNFYRHGLLGNFMGAGHLLARMLGGDPRAILRASTKAEQRHLFDAHLAPVFEKPLFRWLIRQPASLYGLGIPPAQYRALANDMPGGIAEVLWQRLERLACGFDIKSNYFAWQAFGRGYGTSADAPLPPYLQRENFALLRSRSDRLHFEQCAMTTCFKPEALFGQASFDRIFISYALSMIPPWRDVLMRSAECLSADGSLHVVDFGDQSGLPIWFRFGLNKWLGWFDVTPRTDLRLSVNDVATALNMRGRVASLFRGYAVHAVVERAFR